MRCVSSRAFAPQFRDRLDINKSVVVCTTTNASSRNRIEPPPPPGSRHLVSRAYSISEGVNRCSPHNITREGLGEQAGKCFFVEVMYRRFNFTTYIAVSVSPLCGRKIPAVGDVPCTFKTFDLSKNYAFSCDDAITRRRCCCYL